MFLSGIFIGCCLGVLITSLFAVGKNADEKLEMIEAEMLKEQV
ncbi:MAG: hypothetical protein V3R54_02620 [Thermodesulfovibrionia bacterium]